ncbi:TPA: hypothetical protein MIP50_17285 [Klebsiella pneumoniae]|uniref:Uncharacterized protein n=1 Tax=Klebsiella pneumoniae TaxID=573 RepID=A0A483GH16_KLEPN|nr:hypothetical protein AQD68_02600 [Klebsiella pneumoniae]AVO97132.1 hypothetical protein AM475_21090 [Klebsiella pneumoniae subsp. ozaenae]EGF63505.1 hypothetical protein HMPREF9538_02055 [Klebsiella sp. MS 92-3]EKF79310.1 Hypothetical protein B819_98812 [Klebsiella pneumoniae subsp. pneumoniae KpQ3]OYG20762.1 hypothetical protein CI646_18145 [Klebsiella pneumoniae subsp. pneumoniae]
MRKICSILKTGRGEQKLSRRSFSFYSVQVAEKRFLLINESTVTAIPQMRLNLPNPQMISSAEIIIYRPKDRYHQLVGQ